MLKRTKFSENSDSSIDYHQIWHFISHLVPTQDDAHLTLE